MGSDGYVDDSYFSLLFDSGEDIFPISNEKYADSLQLQEVLMSSVFAARQALEVKPSKKLKPSSSSSSDGESSYSFCEICMDRKDREEMFISTECSHSFCSDCISKHVAARIHDNISRVTCPDVKCERVLDPYVCRSIVSEKVFDKWIHALCEALIVGKEFYCPYKNCSEIFVEDGDEVVLESECPSCQRLFCGQCKVPWHSGVSCDEYQKLDVNERGAEDIMLMELAKKKEWKRCPGCKFVVEKNDGCLHISCRCGFQFCYKCGKNWTSSHAC